MSRDADNSPASATGSPMSAAARDADEPRKLTYAERKQARFQMRVEKWETRLASPPPPRYLHRTVITFAMMAAMLGLLWLLVFGGPTG